MTDKMKNKTREKKEISKLLHTQVIRVIRRGSGMEIRD